MRKIYVLLVAFLTILPTAAMAALAESERDQVSGFTGTLSSIFSTEMGVKLILALISVILTVVISKITREKLFRYLERNSEGEGREEMIGVITRSVNIAILLIGATVTLSVLGIDLGIFMGGIGFGLGFTLKSFLTNFVAGIMMVTQGFYHIGDIINIAGKTGTIKKINSLFTSVEQFDGVIFYIPNSRFMEENVANYHSNDRRRVEIDVGVDYETDILKAKNVMFQVIDQFPNILKAPEPDIFVLEFDDSSINLSLRFWINSKDEYFQIKSNVTETINLAFKQAGITIPFPQMTISNRGESKAKLQA